MDGHAFAACCGAGGHTGKGGESEQERRDTFPIYKPALIGGVCHVGRKKDRAWFIYTVPSSTHPGPILKAKALHDKDRASPEKGGLGWMASIRFCVVEIYENDLRRIRTQSVSLAVRILNALLTNRDHTRL